MWDTIKAKDLTKVRPLEHHRFPLREGRGALIPLITPGARLVCPASDFRREHICTELAGYKAFGHGRE